MNTPEVGLLNMYALLKVAQQSVTKIISLTFVNLVTPKAGAKQELLLNRPEAGLLNKSSHLAPALGSSSSFRCDQIHNCYRYELGHTLLCYLSQT